MPSHVKPIRPGDNTELCRALSSTLKALGFDVVSASSEEDALDELQRRPVDAILLDIDMPGVSGDICRRIRKKAPYLPILLLSARDRDEHRANTLVSGAGDRQEDDTITIGEIELDHSRRSVRKDGSPVSLAPREFELLYYLMERRGKPIAYQALIDRIWGSGSGKRREHLRRIICLLRKKLEDDATTPQYLLTETGFGFRFCEDVSPVGGKAGAIV